MVHEVCPESVAPSVKLKFNQLCFHVIVTFVEVTIVESLKQSDLLLNRPDGAPLHLAFLINEPILTKTSSAD
jgi:hypothetical protein